MSLLTETYTSEATRSTDSVSAKLENLVMEVIDLNALIDSTANAMFDYGANPNADAPKITCVEESINFITDQVRVAMSKQKELLVRIKG